MGGFVLEFEMKGTKARFAQTPPMGDNVYTIMDYAAKTAAVVSDAKKQVTVMSMDFMQQGGAAKKALVAEPMDKTGAVLGYPCEFYRVTSHNGDKSEGCLAPGICIRPTASRS
jgi:hypothetical protein